MFKKRWVIILFVLPVLALTVSLYTQFRFLRDMHEMRQEYFLSNVKNAVDQAVEEVEREAVAQFVASQLDLRNMVCKMLDDWRDDERRTRSSVLDNRIRDLVSWNSSANRSRVSDRSMAYLEDTIPPLPPTVKDSRSLFTIDVQKRLLDAYLFHQDALNEVILSSIIDLESDIHPSFDKISYSYLDASLKYSLEKVGVYEDFIIRIYNKDNDLVYEKGPSHNAIATPENSVHHTLFSRISMSNSGQGVVEVVFYEHNRYITTHTYTVATIFTTLVLLILFAVALVFFVRQQRFERGRKDFVHNMTHELKTPVTSIKLASEMLDEDVLVQDPTRRKRLLGAMQSETKRLFFLIEKILQFTLVNESKIRFKPVLFDAHDLLEDAITVYTFKCEEKMGGMTSDLSAKNSYLNVDKMHFQNIIFNVLDNAIKYSKHKVPPRLHLSTSNPKPSVLRIEIKDNGIGISRQDQRNIFRQYYRVDTGDVHDVKGFGLGLSYVKATIKTMKGRVKVESEIGVGTTMIFELPTEEAPSDEQ